MKKTRFTAAALAALLCGCGGGGDGDAGSGSDLGSPLASRLSSITITSTSSDQELGSFSGTTTATFTSNADARSQATADSVTAPLGTYGNLTYVRSSGDHCLLESTVSYSYSDGSNTHTITQYVLYVNFYSRDGNTLLGYVDRVSVYCSYCGNYVESLEFNAPVGGATASGTMMVTVELTDDTDGGETE